MNARQKAKKYKRMYEELLNRPVEYKVKIHKIDTLKFERRCPTELVNSSYFQHCMVKDIVRSLAESLDNYVNYHTEFCPYTNDYRFVGEIKVVKTDKED